MKRILGKQQRPPAIIHNLAKVLVIVLQFSVLRDTVDIWTHSLSGQASQLTEYPYSHLPEDRSTTEAGSLP